MPGAFDHHDPRFAHVTGPDPALELVLEVDAHEGPVYAADEDALYVTSLPPSAIRRIALDGARFPVAPSALTTPFPDANRANGMAMDRDGRLVVCEQGAMETPARIRRIVRRGGPGETLVDAFEGAPLNSPNDVIVAADRSVWFTDPSYGHVQGFRPPPALADRVYRHDPATGATRAVADGFDKPNGLALSPDGRTLYVGDSGADQEPGRVPRRRPHHIEAFTVGTGGALSGRRVFAVVEEGVPDGMAVDAAGRLFSTFAGGVEVRDPDGALLGAIRLPGAVNLTFGGPGLNVLFITADTAVWAVRLVTQGA
jgi:gluconolactonase